MGRQVDPHPLIRCGRETWSVPHESGESILPRGQQCSYRTQPALGKDRVCRTLRETPRLSSRNGPNRGGEIHKPDDGLCELMPSAIAGIRHMAYSPQIAPE